MSIWGSLLGGFIGFSIGGPLGALLGSLIGGKISSNKLSSKKNKNNQTQQLFALSLIVLTAKLSKSDGLVTKDELLAIKNKLNIPDIEINNVAKIFNTAKQSSDGFEDYADQISDIFSDKPVILEEVLNILFYVAEADGKVSKSEYNYIKKVSEIFGLSEDQFNQIRESRLSLEEMNPYTVLGCNKNDDLKTIRKKYILLTKEHHPDLLINKGVPNEIIEQSKKKIRAINVAWDEIQKQRKL